MEISPFYFIDYTHWDKYSKSNKLKETDIETFKQEVYTDTFNDKENLLSNLKNTWVCDISKSIPFMNETHKLDHRLLHVAEPER